MPPPGPPGPCPPPPGPRIIGPPPPDDPDPSFSGPNPMVLAIRRLRVYCAGPRPKLRGRMASPGLGLGSSNPYGVAITPGLLGSAAIPGGLVNNVWQQGAR